MICKKDESIVTRRLDDEMILVPIRNKAADMDSIYVLNEVGARIWELIDGKRDTKDIIVVIREEYDSPDDIEVDILNFLSDLKNIGAIKEIS